MFKWRVKRVRLYDSTSAVNVARFLPHAVGGVYRWGVWSAWSQCSVTCGSGGVHIRKRMCLDRETCTKDFDEDSKPCFTTDCLSADAAVASGTQDITVYKNEDNYIEA